MSTSGKILPVILSGGAGSRLWPLSRHACPKQFLPLVSEKTLIQETVERVSGEGFLPPVFMCNAAHTDMISEHMKAVGQDISALIIEPVARNTAPCAAIAGLYAAQYDHLESDLAAPIEAPLVLLLPADHHIQNPEAFRETIARAQLAARAGYLVTFGITPDKVETGYGYIERGEKIDDHAFYVATFKEKPDFATAQSYVNSGNYMWNGGIFLFDPHSLLSEMDAYAPDISNAARAAFAKSERKGQHYYLDKTLFENCPSQSIDYALMEKTDKAAILPVQMRWTDIGSFTALHELIKTGDAGNALRGDVLDHKVENCHIRTDGPLVTAIGVKDLTIIVEDGKVLVLGHEAAQDVKIAVNTLKAQGRTDQL